MRLLLNHLAIIMALMAALASPALAADIHTNGTGGGIWHDPLTWKGGQVPTAEDTAVIAMRDSVTFEADHSQQVTCAELFLDPEAVLILKPVEDRTTALTVAGPIESYGILRLDGTRTPTATLELRFGGAAGKREFNLRPNAALLVYGQEGYSEEGPNVRLTALPLEDGTRDPVRIIAKGEASIEVNHTRLSDVVFNLHSIDNTGSKATERLNIRSNQFDGYCGVYLHGCDTPSIRGNTFDATQVKDVGKLHRSASAAIHTIHGKLIEIRDNQIRGPYPRGIFVQYDTDSSAAENIIDGPTGDGIYWHGVNGMLSRNLITNTNHGVTMHAGSAVLEEVVVDNVRKLGFHISKFEAQLTTCRARNMPEDSMVMYLDDATVTLLNCDIGYDQITTGKERRGDFWAESMQYLVVKVGGNVPEGAMVEPRTSDQSGGVPKGKADLNVRNAPARLGPDKVTPLPGNQNALVLRAWRLENNGKPTMAPFYDLRILAPAAAGEQPKVLATQIIEPTEAWFRPEPGAPEPTVEVTLQ